MYKIAGTVLISSAVIVHTLMFCTIQIDQSIRSAASILASRDSAPDSMQAVKAMEFGVRGYDSEFRYLVGGISIIGISLFFVGVFADHRRTQENAG